MFFTWFGNGSPYETPTSEERETAISISQLMDDLGYDAPELGDSYVDAQKKVLACLKDLAVKVPMG